jgi:hypothetical protein
MSDAIENEMQIAANSMQDLIPPKSRKLYDLNIMLLATKVKFLSSLEKNYIFLLYRRLSIPI